MLPIYDSKTVTLYRDSFPLRTDMEIEHLFLWEVLTQLDWGNGTAKKNTTRPTRTVSRWHSFFLNSVAKGLLHMRWASPCARLPQEGEVERNRGRGSAEGPKDVRVSPLRLLNALQGTEGKRKGCDLLYVEAKINGTRVKVMVDTGATHNFIAEDEAKALGLGVLNDGSRIKAVNSEAKKVAGVAQVDLEVGEWRGPCTFMVVPLDDFRVILGMEFLIHAHVHVVPYLGGIFITGGDTPSFVGEAGRENEVQLQGREQLKEGIRKKEETHVATIIEENNEGGGPVPKEVEALLESYGDVMPSELPKELPPKRGIDHRIELVPGARPPAQAPYRMPPAHLEELRRQLKDLLDAGLLRPSKAPYGAPVLFQRKKDGSLRMCVDYRALNKVTVKNKYPVPNVEDLFDRLGRAKFFSKMDLRSGYYQVRIAEGDVAKTTCVTRYGSFEFLVMPFGLTNAPATFCNLMNDVFRDYIDDFVVVYLDDIVVYSRDLSKHLEHLEKVFERLRSNSLYLKPEKCAFAQQQITFLGHIVGDGEMRMDPKKIEAILEWPTPNKVSDLRSFLGLTNYYRKFVRHSSKIAAPLTDFLNKNKLWEWGPERRHSII